MTFSATCKSAALLSTILFATYLLAPAQLLAIFGVPASETGNFVARRAAMLFASFAILTWSARNLPPSSYRTSFCYAAITVTAGLAVLGLVELARGFAGPLILIAVVVEIVFAVLFLRHVRHGGTPVFRLD